jgi:SAM-dependent methyltransferase
MNNEYEQVADAKTRFSNRVDDYVKYRPGYPPRVIEILESECGLTEASVIADVGSGTGILTELFLKNGNNVWAVEPNCEMREAAERILGGYPCFHSVDGAAESTTLPDACADFVTAAQAFHWFDRARAKVEFRRILRPGGWAVILWNHRLTDATPFLADYERLLMKFATDYEKVDRRRITPDILRDFFAPSAYRSQFFPNNQTFDLEGLKGRLLSSSYAPAPGHPRHEPMIDELRSLFDLHQRDGRVAIEYTTQMYYGQW